MLFSNHQLDYKTLIVEYNAMVSKIISGVTDQSLESFWKSLCLFTCLHLDTNSDRLFKILSFAYMAISSFPARHRLHFINVLLNSPHVRRIFPVIDGMYCLSFKFQTSLESSVAFLYFNVLSGYIWLAYLCLNALAANLIYIYLLPVVWHIRSHRCLLNDVLFQAFVIDRTLVFSNTVTGPLILWLFVVVNNNV